MVIVLTWHAEGLGSNPVRTIIFFDFFSAFYRLTVTSKVVQPLLRPLSTSNTCHFSDKRLVRTYLLWQNPNFFQRFLAFTD